MKFAVWLISLAVIGCSSRPLYVASDRGADFWPTPKPKAGFDVNVRSTTLSAGLAAQDKSMTAVAESLNEIDTSLKIVATSIDTGSQNIQTIATWITGGGAMTIVLALAGYGGYKKYKNGGAKKA